MEFQTPISSRISNHREESKSSISMETPIDQIDQSENNSDQIDSCSIADVATKNSTSTENQTNHSETIKMKFIENKIENVGNDQHHHTPISFKMNKFIMCFKSEPDLSRVQNINNDNEPLLNRGRFIAKKLLNGVSMINLRRPTANSNEKATVLSVKTAINTLEVEVFRPFFS